MSEATVVDAEAVEVGTDVVPIDPAPSTTLFRTDDPVEVLERATAVANALKPAIANQRMVVNIHGRDHITVEGWQTLGAMLGVTPVCVWTHPIEKGWEARVEARTLDGRVIGAAEAECLRDERQWKTRDDFALRSMAQTRATSKALASVLRFVATLGGYEGTPAEEMPAETQQRATSTATATAQPKGERPVTATQKGKINKLCGDASLSSDQAAAVFNWLAGKSHSDRLTTKEASTVIEALEKQGAEAVLSEVAEAAADAKAPDHERAAKIAERFLGAS